MRIVMVAVAAIGVAVPAYASPKTSATPKSEAVKEYKAGMQKMHRDMNITYSGDADIDFAKGMTPHHQGAVDMAETVLKYGKDPEIRKLAKWIIYTQEQEIQYMTQWLNRRNEVPGAGNTAPAAGGHAHHGHHGWR